MRMFAFFGKVSWRFCAGLAPEGRGIRPISAQGKTTSSSIPPKRAAYLINIFALALIFIAISISLSGCGGKGAKVKYPAPKVDEPIVDLWDFEGIYRSGNGDSISNLLPIPKDDVTRNTIAFTEYTPPNRRLAIMEFMDEMEWILVGSYPIDEPSILSNVIVDEKGTVLFYVITETGRLMSFYRSYRGIWSYNAINSHDISADMILSLNISKSGLIGAIITINNQVHYANLINSEWHITPLGLSYSLYGGFVYANDTPVVLEVSERIVLHMILTKSIESKVINLTNAGYYFPRPVIAADGNSIYVAASEGIAGGVLVIYGNLFANVWQTDVIYEGNLGKPSELLSIKAGNGEIYVVWKSALVSPYRLFYAVNKDEMWSVKQVGISSTPISYASVAENEVFCTIVEGSRQSIVYAASGNSNVKEN